MIDNFTSNRLNFTGGVKSQTHRRQWRFNGFNGFNGFSLKGGRGRVRPRTGDLPSENRREIREMREIGLLSCGLYFTPASNRCEIGCEIVGWLI